VGAGAADGVTGMVGDPDGRRPPQVVLSARRVTAAERVTGASLSALSTPPGTRPKPLSGSSAPWSLDACRSSVVCCRPMTHRLAVAAGVAAVLLASVDALAQGSGNQPPPLLSDLVDVSRDFRDYTNEYYLADALANFDPATGAGTLTWKRHQLAPRLAFDNMKPGLQPYPGAVFPSGEHATDPELPLQIEFVSPRTIRLRLRTTTTGASRPDSESLMLVKEVPRDGSWRHEAIAGGHRYTSAAGSVTITEKPWRLELRDASGKLLTRTQHTS